MADFVTTPKKQRNWKSGWKFGGWGNPSSSGRNWKDGWRPGLGPRPTKPHPIAENYKQAIAKAKMGFSGATKNLKPPQRGE